MGHLIAGGAGAVIGSRKKVDEVKSELVTHDTRETYINYFDPENVRRSLFFDVDAYQVLNDLIPDKEYNIVSQLNTSKLINSTPNSDKKNSITDQIRELSALKDEGIISEQEFNEKKKILLDRIK